MRGSVLLVVVLAALAVFAWRAECRALDSNLEELEYEPEEDYELEEDYETEGDNQSEEKLVETNSTTDAFNTTIGNNTVSSGGGGAGIVAPIFKCVGNEKRGRDAQCHQPFYPGLILGPPGKPEPQELPPLPLEFRKSDGTVIRIRN